MEQVVNKGGICSGSCRLHRDVFGRWGRGAIMLLTGLLSEWSWDLSKYLSAELLFAFPEIKQTNQVTSKHWLGVTLVLTFQFLWPLTQRRCFFFQSTFWENVQQSQPEQTFMAQEDASVWAMTGEEKAIKKAVHPFGVLQPDQAGLCNSYHLAVKSNKRRCLWYDLPVWSLKAVTAPSNFSLS